MTNPSMTLDAVVQGGPGVWTTLTPRELNDALTASAAQGAEHLLAFAEKVEAWWKADGIDREEGLGRRRWISDVADVFLSTTDSERLADLAARLPTLDRQLQFIAMLLNRGSTRRHIALALNSVTQRFAAEVPAASPQEEVKDWAWRWRLLITAHGLRSGSSGGAAIGAVLAVSPEWLLVTGIEGLGLLNSYDNLYKDLAAALALTDRPEVPRAVSVTLAKNTAPIRLAEQMALIARAGREQTRPASGRPEISADAARKFLSAVEAQLTSAGATTARDRLRRFVQSWRDNETELRNLYGGYLNAAPRNHEEVFDFLTRHGTRRRGFALSDWGGKSVSVWESGSMRLSSIHYEGPVDRNLPSPDFDSGPMLNQVSPDAIVRLVLDQPEPDFAFQYLELFAKHPDFEKIAAALTSNRDWVAHWEAMDGTRAVVVWDKLEYLSARSPSFKKLEERLQPILLSRLPTEFLSNDRLAFLPEPLEKAAGELIERRFASATDLGVIEDLADAAASHFGREERDRMVAAVDVARLAVPDGTDHQAETMWLYELSRLLSHTPMFAARVLEHLTAQQARTFVQNDEVFAGTDAITPSSIPQRLALKVQLVRIWAAESSGEVRAALDAGGQRDFAMLFAAGFLYQMPPEAPAPSLSPMHAWLDLVVELGTAALVNTYLVSLLASATPESSARVDHHFSRVATFVDHWMTRHSWTLPENAWNAVEKQLASAVHEHDVEAAAAVACFTPPNTPERLAQFREHAVAGVREAMRKAGGHRDTSAFAKLRSLVAQHAPHLLLRLTQ
jgi:hypothetical protein